MEQVERIKLMEGCLQRASIATAHLSVALDKYVETLEDIRLLSDYYGSNQWQQDFADDEAGRLPQDLQRSVLSEDAVWNLLEDIRDLRNRMLKLKESF